jgi:hypothetical protein
LLSILMDPAAQRVLGGIVALGVDIAAGDRDGVQLVATDAASRICSAPAV